MTAYKEIEKLIKEDKGAEAEKMYNDNFGKLNEIKGELTKLGLDADKIDLGKSLEASFDKAKENGAQETYNKIIDAKVSTMDEAKQKEMKELLNGISGEKAIQIVEKMSGAETKADPANNRIIQLFTNDEKKDDAKKDDKILRLEDF